MSAKKTHEGGKTLKSYDLYYYCTVTVLLQCRVLGAWNEDGDVKQEENKNNSYWQKKRKPLPAITPKKLKKHLTLEDEEPTLTQEEEYVDYFDLTVLSDTDDSDSEGLMPICDDILDYKLEKPLTKMESKLKFYAVILR